MSRVFHHSVTLGVTLGLLLFSALSLGIMSVAAMPAKGKPDLADLDSATNSINAIDEAGKTPLMHAISSKKNAKDKVKALLKAGADPNAANADGITALHFLATRDIATGDIVKAKTISSIAKLLIAAGAKVDARNKSGYTALMMAASSIWDMQDLARTLITAGADVNATNQYGNNILKHAVRHPRNIETTKLLLTHGADPNVRNPDAYDPTDYMGDYGATDRMALSWAVIKDNTDAVNALLAAGAHVNAKDIDEGFTPLMWAVWAVKKNSESSFKILLEAGADPNLTNEYGETALIKAASKNDKFVPPLLDAGADPNVRDKNGNTALMHTLNTDTMQHLLQKGADINAINNDGKTVLTQVLRKSMPMEPEVAEVFQFLILEGADPNIADAQGKTVLMRAAQEDAVDVVKVLLSAGADPNATDESGYTPLMYAALYSSLRSANVLLVMGADPNVTNEDGESALMIAASHQKQYVFSTLIAGGAELSATDKDGNTAMKKAMQRIKQQRTPYAKSRAKESAEYLLAEGIKLIEKKSNSTTTCERLLL